MRCLYLSVMPYNNCGNATLRRRYVLGYLTKNYYIQCGLAQSHHRPKKLFNFTTNRSQEEQKIRKSPYRPSSVPILLQVYSFRLTAIGRVRCACCAATARGAFLKGQHTRAPVSRSHYEFCSCPFPTNNGSFPRTCTTTERPSCSLCVINILLSFASQLTCPAKNEITIDF